MKTELVLEGNRLKEALHTCEQIEKLAEIGQNVDIDSVQERIIVKEELLLRMNKEKNLKSSKIDLLAEQTKMKKKNLESMQAEETSLRNAVDAMVSGPQEECRKCVEELLKFSPSDVKTLTKINKPSLGIRLCCEMLRTIFDPNFKPKKNAAETWSESQKFLMDKTFFIKIATLDAETLSVDQIKVLKKYVERVEFNANRIANESLVCACLCRWIGTFLELSCTLRVMEEQNDESKFLREQIKNTELKYEKETSEMEQLKADVLKLTSSIRENEQVLANDRRLCDYRLRSGDLLAALVSHRQRWKRELLSNEKKQNELVGNTLLFSIFRALLLSHDRSVTQTAVGLCTAHLNSENIGFDASTATPSNVINLVLRNLRSSRRFCLFINENNDDILTNLHNIIPSATFVDMTSLGWNDPIITVNIPKYIYSIVPTVFHNFRSCPPSDMYEILMKSEEKEICYKNHSVELPEDILFVFVAKEISIIPDQLRKLMEIIIVSSPIEKIDDTEKTERNELANILGEFTAADILESRDLTRKAMHFAS